MSKDTPAFGNTPGFGSITIICPVCGREDLITNLDQLATNRTVSPVQKFSCGHAADSATGEAVN